MPTQDKLQQFNLANYYASVVAPRNAELSTALTLRRQMAIDYHICSMFESYWWLNLGVELGYFPEQQAETILLHFFVDLPYYHEFLNRNPNLFSGGLITSLRSALTNKRFFELPDSNFFSSPETLRVPFQLILGQANDLALDPLATYAISVATFGNPSLWDQIVGQELSASELIGVVRMSRVEGAAMAFSESAGIATVAMGFLRSVQHMLSQQSCFNDLNQSDEIDDQDGYLLARRVKSIQGWRFFALPDSRLRFEQVGSKLNIALAEKLDPESVSEADRNFLIRLNQLIDQWRGGLTITPGG